MKLTSENIHTVLENVLDPETHLSIVAMGLIYGVWVEQGGRVKIHYTLTTPLCPLAGVIQDRIREEIQKSFPDFEVSAESVVLTAVFDPPWSLERMTPEARAELGI